MKNVGVLEQLPSDIVKEILSKPTVFQNEGPLSLEYVPLHLPHREDKLGFLIQLFRFALEKPAAMSQRVLITGDVGTGKTVLSQRFGLDITKAAKNLYISQSAISKQIAMLEEEIGVKLFIRTNKIVRLTPSGLVLMK